MQIALRHILLLALALPGLLAGSGASLVLCYCDMGDPQCALDLESADECDADCCDSEDEGDDGPIAEAAPCPGCHHLLVDEVDLALTVAHSVDLAPAPVATLTPIADDATLGVRDVHPPIGRAPPGTVRPPALLPGVRPLRV